MENRNETVSVILLLLVVVLASFGVYLNTHHRRDDGGSIARQEFGRIVYRKNLVHRKYFDSFVWNLLREEDRVFWQDAIFVGEGSIARFSLDDGSMLEVGENSLVVLEKGATKVDNQPIDVTEVRILRGSVALGKRGSVSGRPVHIVLGEKVKLKINDGADLAVRKEEGKASILSRGKGTVVQVEREGNSPLELKVAPPQEDQSVALESIDIESTEGLSSEVRRKARIEEGSSKLVSEPERDGGSKLLSELDRQMPLQTERLDEIDRKGGEAELSRLPSEAAVIRRDDIQALDLAPSTEHSNVTSEQSDQDQSEAPEAEAEEPKAVETQSRRDIRKGTLKTKVQVEMPRFLEPTEPYYCIKTNSAGLRQTPSTQGRILSKLPRSSCGSVLKITRPTKGQYWAHVLFEDTEGWIHSSEIQLKADLPYDREPSDSIEEKKLEKKPKQPDYYNYFQNR